MDGEPKVDLGSWLQYTETAAITLITGVGATLAGAYFWFRGKQAQQRERDAEVANKEAKLKIETEHALSNEVKATADWQSELFKRRIEDLEKDLAAQKNAMTLLHAEHKECIRRDAEKEGRLQFQQLQMDAMSKELQKLRETVKELHAIINRIYPEGLPKESLEDQNEAS